MRPRPCFSPEPKRRMKNNRIILLLAASLACSPLFSADPATPDPAARLAEYRRLAGSVHYESGSITLKGGLAKVALPEGYRYLNPADSATVLEKIWGNPRQKETLGMIMPADFDPLRPNAW